MHNFFVIHPVCKVKYVISRYDFILRLGWMNCLKDKSFDEFYDDELYFDIDKTHINKKKIISGNYILYFAYWVYHKEIMQDL